MQLEFIAHATFLLRLDSGRSIVIDPYKAHEFNRRFDYPTFAPLCDFAVITHEHIDHAWLGDLRGNPVVVRQAWCDRELRISSVFAYHDAFGGTKFGGYVLMKVIEADGQRLCHLGDVGEPLSDAQIAALGHCDVAIVPIGGFYTIDAHAAHALATRLAARTTIPCHFKTPLCTLPIADATPFLRLAGTYTHFPHATYPIDSLPPGIVLLDDAFNP